jgi:predicted metal-dependent hydrolase
MPATAALPAHITIGDLDFTVRASEHRHTVGITVDRDGSLLLHAPTGSDPDAVASWARSKRGWVFRKLAEKHLLLPASPAKDFVTGEGFGYLGRHYRLQLTGDPAGTDVKLERGRLRMPRCTAEAARAKTQ